MKCNYASHLDQFGWSIQMVIYQTTRRQSLKSRFVSWPPGSCRNSTADVHHTVNTCLDPSISHNLYANVEIRRCHEGCAVLLPLNGLRSTLGQPYLRVHPASPMALALQRQADDIVRISTARNGRHIQNILPIAVITARLNHVASPGRVCLCSRAPASTDDGRGLSWNVCGLATGICASTVSTDPIRFSLIMRLAPPGLLSPAPYTRCVFACVVFYTNLTAHPRRHRVLFLRPSCLPRFPFDQHMFDTHT